MSADEGRALRATLAACAREGEVGRALEHMHRLLALDPTAASAQAVLRAFDTLRPSMPWVVPLRVRVLRSFTLEPIVPLVRAFAAVHGVALAVEIDPLGTYAQSILDPSSTLHTDPTDVVVLALRLRDVAPELDDGFAEHSAASIEAALSRAESELRARLVGLRGATRARILVHGFEAPDTLALGVLDGTRLPSQRACVARLEATLVALARELPEVHVLDVARALASVGAERAHDPVRDVTMRLPYRHEGLVALAHAWVARFVPMAGRIAKVAVVDLDHTLWGGVLGEDGEHGIALGIEHPGAAHRALQRTLRDLVRRGMMLAVASKNDEADALRVLDTHEDMLLRTPDFAAFQIHWRPKTESIEAIARALHVGVDALMFVDDNPVERAAVREAWPMVHVVELGEDPVRYAAIVGSHPAAQRLALTDEDAARSRLVAEERARERLAASAESLEDFHRSLGMRLDWLPASVATRPRIAQLTQKTNQFNLTTVRRTESEIDALLADPAYLVRTARIRDRFGDHGLVGLVIARVDAEEAELDTFLMSCRVIGRTAETAMLALLEEELRARGVRTLRARFAPTAKNGPAREFLPTHGFVAHAAHDPEAARREGPSLYARALDADEARAVPAWFEVGRMAGDAP